MSASLPQILTPAVVNRTISELKVNNTRLQNFFIGGGGTAPQSGRGFSWDIFNETREVASGRSPGTGPARRTPQSVGNMSGTFPRVHEEIPIDFERVHNLRTIGSLGVDIGGENYIMRQEAILAQRFVNHREFQFAAMARGKYYYTREGDDLNVSLSSGAQEVNFQVPAGNKGTLDMLGSGALLTNWSSASADIPAQLAAVNEAFEILVGRPLTDIWIRQGDFHKYVLQNDKVRALAGTSNRPYESYGITGDQNDFEAVLAGLSSITWHITNGVLSVNGSTTKIIEADRALFCPRPDPSWIQYGEGSEVVVEYPGATPSERFGSYFWAESTVKPAGYNLIGVMNGLPFLYNPSCIAWATIAS